MKTSQNKNLRSKEPYRIKANQYAKYNLLFLLSLFSSLIISFGLNSFVDPYGIISKQSWSYLFTNKPDQEAHVRLNKYINLSYLEPNILFLGSSRIAGGMQTTEKSLSQHQVVYNLGLPAAHIDEIKYYLQYAINHDKHHHLNRVILGIDFFMFKTAYNKETDFIKSKFHREPNILDFLSTYLSLDSLFSTNKTIQASFVNNNNSHRKIVLTPAKFRYWLVGFYQNWYQDYQLSTKKLQDLQEIVNLCRKNNIKLDIFISPIHATHNEVMNGRNLWSVYEQWKREVVKITPVWDFSDFGSVTMEPISNRMKFYVDNSHYTPFLGDMIERRMSGKNTQNIPSDFGRLINTSNIESHLTEIRLHRQQWIKASPRDYNFVTSIIQDLKKKEH